MKKILLIAALALAAATPTTVNAQRGGAISRPSMPTMRAPTVTSRPYSAPVTSTPRSYAAPTPPSVVRTAPVTRAAPTYRQAPRPEATVRTVPSQVARRSVPAATRTTPSTTRNATGANRPRRTTYRSYAWTAPATMPFWWMAATHRPYAYAAYDDFIRRCIDTPRRERSEECVRALRERGITA